MKLLDPPSRSPCEPPSGFGGWDDNGPWDNSDDHWNPYEPDPRPDTLGALVSVLASVGIVMALYYFLRV